jgi:hypothetical protein
VAQNFNITSEEQAEIMIFSHSNVLKIYLRSSLVAKTHLLLSLMMTMMALVTLASEVQCLEII